MQAEALLAELQAARLMLTADGEQLRVTPASALTAAQRTAIRTLNGELLALLAGPAADGRIPPGYVAQMKGQLGRWAALGRPALPMPRWLGIGAPYPVDDLGEWFLTSLADPPATGWAPRKPSELAILDALLTELERSDEEEND